MAPIIVVVFVVLGGEPKCKNQLYSRCQDIQIKDIEGQPMAKSEKYGQKTIIYFGQCFFLAIQFYQEMVLLSFARERIVKESIREGRRATFFDRSADFDFFFDRSADP